MNREIPESIRGQTKKVARRLEVGLGNGPCDFESFARATVPVNIDNIAARLELVMSESDVEAAFEIAYNLLDHRSHDAGARRVDTVRKYEMAEEIEELHGKDSIYIKSVHGRQHRGEF